MRRVPRHPLALALRIHRHPHQHVARLVALRQTGRIRQRDNVLKDRQRVGRRFFGICNARSVTVTSCAFRRIPANTAIKPASLTAPETVNSFIRVIARWDPHPRRDKNLLRSAFIGCSLRAHSVTSGANWKGRRTLTIAGWPSFIGGSKRHCAIACIAENPNASSSALTTRGTCTRPSSSINASTTARPGSLRLSKLKGCIGATREMTFSG